MFDSFELFCLKRKFRAQKFVLSHCVGNASGTNESIPLSERRTFSSSSTQNRQSSIGVPAESSRFLTNQTNRSASPTASDTTSANNQKKTVSTNDQTICYLNVKRTSDSQVSNNNQTEENRRRSSLSAELNGNERSLRKVSATNSTGSMSVQTNKENMSNNSFQSVKLVTAVGSNERVVIIDTTAVCSTSEIVSSFFYLLSAIFIRYTIQLTWGDGSTSFGQMNKCV